MRFYSEKHRYYCGIDLHTKTMYICIIDGDGKILFHANAPVNVEILMQIIEPYHIQNTKSQYNLPDLQKSIKYKSNRHIAACKRTSATRSVCVADHKRRWQDPGYGDAV